MKCNEIRDLLSLYIDHEFDESQRKIVEDHLAVCGSCHTEYMELLKLISLLSEIEEVPVPDSFESRWKNALQEETRHSFTAIKKETKKKINWRVFTSVAAVLAVGVISISLYHDVLGTFPQTIKGSEQSGLAAEMPASPIENSKGLETDNHVDLQAAKENPDETRVIIESESQNLKAFYDTSDTSNTSDAIYGQIANNPSAPAPEPENTLDYHNSENIAAADAGVDITSSTTSRSLSAMSGKTFSSEKESVPAQGLERNTAAMRYYGNLMEEKLKGYDYQITDSSYVNGEWHFEVFIFHGKDGNTYNEDVLIIGKDGAINVTYADEFLGLQ